MLFISLFFVLSSVYAEQASPAAQTAAQELVTQVRAILTEPEQQALIQEATVDGHTLIFIGENDHTNFKYRQLSSAFQHMAVGRQLVFFKEALPRDAHIESLWSRFRFLTPDSGYLFGVENDLAYLISDWAVELGRMEFSAGSRDSSQNDNFLFKFIFSNKAMPIWQRLVQKTTQSPLHDMVIALDPQIHAFYDAATTGNSQVVPLQESFKPEEWKALYIALLNEAAEDPDLPESQRSDVISLLEGPLNLSALVGFNDVFGRQYRSDRMAENIRGTLAHVPVEVPVVVLVGAGHLQEVFEALSVGSPIPALRE